MKRYFTLIAFIFCLVQINFSQTTLNYSLPDSLQNVNPTKKILLVPFEPKLYMSEIDQKVGIESKKSFKELLTYFRKSLINNLFADLSKLFIPVNLKNNDNTQSDQTVADEEIVYGNMLYRYEQPESQSENQAEKKKKVKEDKRGGVEKGQIVQYYTDYKGKFMNVYFNDNFLFEHLQKNYNPDLILFITQYEVRNFFDEPSGFGSSIINRELKVHYSLYDIKGNFLNGGYVQRIIPKEMNKDSEIVSTYFPGISVQIRDAILKYYK